ncbi:MAG TPA: 30S ribosomal protein S4 [Candidatus Vogelbacteria bacterium]|nr:30S ribosomal protein S4 [Candidatus Vogelbacteria bacterium]
MKIGPKYKICRRLGERIFPKCQTTKFVVSGAEKKKGGQKKRPKQLSEYGRQLLEKQKARYTYGVTEKQFSNYVKEAGKSKGNNPQATLYKLLESRLDNIVFRLGFANSRLFARQLVSHGHIMVNDRKCSIPSRRIKIGDKVSIRPQSLKKNVFSQLDDKIKETNIPSWLLFDSKKKEGEVKADPIVNEGEFILNFSTILEFYSRV